MLMYAKIISMVIIFNILNFKELLEVGKEDDIQTQAKEVVKQLKDKEIEIHGVFTWTEYPNNCFHLFCYV